MVDSYTKAGIIEDTNEQVSKNFEIPKYRVSKLKLKNKTAHSLVK